MVSAVEETKRHKFDRTMVPTVVDIKRSTNNDGASSCETKKHKSDRTMVPAIVEIKRSANDDGAGCRGNEEAQIRSDDGARCCGDEEIDEPQWCRLFLRRRGTNLISVVETKR
eukprot:TRINITY_DN1539_c0_g1_i1.p2 TRINITY_DN1539_c0_g1~~TRINITY_DN1539_c0_g1_i1.p2  ORF type:complete len:113 (+),score=15.00 TRINITY_DN1539_c0_g1_i1:755-1093(+)